MCHSPTHPSEMGEMECIIFTKILVSCAFIAVTVAVNHVNIFQIQRGINSRRLDGKATELGNPRSEQHNAYKI